ncbi:UDP-N-acetylglucosamine 2-epimerase [Jatrophihabitans fulvus]
MTAVGVFIGTRADLSPLVPVLRALADAADLTTRVSTAVAWTAETLQAALRERDVELDVDAVGPPLRGDAPADLVALGGAIATGVAAWLGEHRIDVLVVLGDRWELLYAVPPAVVLGVRVVHLHGGEITEGALDDRVRHAVTKLADRHAVATATAADVVRQLGEPADRVRVTGAPGLDLLVAARPPDADTWRRLLGAEPERPLALVTVHPATATDEPPGPTARAVIDGVRDAGATAIVTHPGADAGRDEILAAIADAAAADPGVLVVPSLGPDYPSVLAGVDVVVGNSSSGVIEASAVGVPAVDVGDRQAGRERAASVRHALPDRVDVAAAVRAALADHPPQGGPYGDGAAAPRIVEVVRAAAVTSRRKPFVLAEAPGVAT